MPVSRGLILRLSILMIATASPLMAQDSVVVDLGALSRRARIEALNDPSLVKDVRAFDERSRSRKGVFIGPEQLDTLAPLLFQDIISGRIDAVAVDQVQNLRMRTPTSNSIPFCTPDIFLDNQWISRAGYTSLIRLDERWGATSVVAVEIYERPWNIPESFSPVLKNGHCGLIAFWTSRRQSAAP